MKTFALFAALFCTAAIGQDVPPVPQPSVEIKQPSEIKRDDFNDFSATGHPEKCTFDWIGLPLDHKLKFRESENGKVLTVIGPPGNYTLILSVSDGTAKQHTFSHFTIPGDVPPKPDPPTPPVVKTLRDKAGAQANEVEKFYVAMLESIGKNEFESVDQFKAVHLELLKKYAIQDNEAVKECLKRLELKTLDAVKSELEKIVAELKAPQPPPTPSGKRTIVLVHETADDDAAMGRLIVNIRDGEIAKYLKDNGHNALILDDDLDAPILSKLRPFDSLPMIYVLDQATQAVIHKQAAPMVSADFLAAIKKGGA